MSQETILQLLKKEGRPMTSAEIAKRLHISRGSVITALCRMKRFNELRISYRMVIYKSGRKTKRKILHYGIR